MRDIVPTQMTHLSSVAGHTSLVWGQFVCSMPDGKLSGAWSGRRIERPRVGRGELAWDSEESPEL